MDGQVEKIRCNALLLLDFHTDIAGGERLGWVEKKDLQISQISVLYNLLLGNFLLWLKLFKL